MNSHSRIVRRVLRRSQATTAVLSLVTVLVGSTQAALAADAPPAGSSEGAAAAAPSTASASADANQSASVKEATARFERGLALYDDGDYDAALVEFSRAYELQPTYKILYNIGKIERVKNDYSAALTQFRRYLEQGGAEIPAERREEVEKEIGVLKERVAQVTIQANVDGATVYVDDVPLCSSRSFDSGCVGTTPLRGPVVVNPGKRKISAVKRGYQNADAQLTVAGGDQNTVRLELFDLRPRAVDTTPRDRAIVAWSVTGALAIGAGVMGVLTLNKKSDYDKDRGLPACANQAINSNSCLTDPAAKLDSDKSSTKTFAAVTDVLTGAAVIGGALSVYFTVKAFNKPSEPEQQAGRFGLHSLRLGAGPGTAVVDGTF
jgi:hypothetical protein